MKKLYLQLLFILFAYTSYATVRNVPSPYNTIQVAIDSSLNGDQSDAMSSLVYYNSVGVSYSKKNNLLSVRCFPNPTSDGVVISYIVPKRTKVHITIIDMNGIEVIHSEEETKYSGQHFHEIDTGMLPKGLYSGALRAGNEVQYFKLVIN